MSGPKQKKKLETKSELTPYEARRKRKRSNKEIMESINKSRDKMDKIFVSTGIRDKNYRQQKQLESKTSSDQHRKRRSTKEIMESINKSRDKIREILNEYGHKKNFETYIDTHVQKTPQAKTNGTIKFKKGGLVNSKAIAKKYFKGTF
tara:strand:- start:39 stop:482 length:444 start_codon:yes stop_codon:yes gene_type:complete